MQVPTIASMREYWKSLKRVTKFQLSLAAVGVLFLLIVVPLLGVLNINESRERTRVGEVTSIDPLTTRNFSGIVIHANVSSMDPNSYTTRLQANGTPTGSYLAPQGGLFERLARGINISFERTKVAIPAGEIIPTLETTAAILSGDPNAYPFDEYRANVKVYAWSFNNATRERVPIALLVVGAIQSWKISAEVDDEDGDVLISLYFKRSMTTRFFSIFVIALMWILSLSAITLASTLWFRDRKVEPPTIAVCTGLLFALPAIRNIQPGAPVIGCSADVVGFFWAMFIDGVAGNYIDRLHIFLPKRIHRNLFTTSLAFILILNYIVKYRKDKPKPEDIETKQKLLKPDTASSGGSAMTIITEPYQRQTSDRSADQIRSPHVVSHSPHPPVSAGSVSQIRLP